MPSEAEAEAAAIDERVERVVGDLVVVVLEMEEEGGEARRARFELELERGDRVDEAGDWWWGAMREFSEWRRSSEVR